MRNGCSNDERYNSKVMKQKGAFVGLSTGMVSGE